MGKTKNTGYLGNEITATAGNVAIDSLAGSGTRMVTADATGVLSTAAIPGGGGGVTSLSAIGSTPNASGGTISGTTLTLQPAGASFGGIVTTGSQTFAGDKTFNNDIDGIGGFFNTVTTSTALITNTIKTRSQNELVIQGQFGDNSWKFATNLAAGSTVSLNGFNLTTDRNISFPDADSTLVTSVNGIPADSTGNITGIGSPAGTSGEIQFNNAGSFSGAANVEIQSGNLKLISTTDPATPTGGLINYAKVVAGRVLPKIIGPSGIDTVMQVGLHGNSIFMLGPANGTTAPTTWGGLLTTSNTISHQQTIASANPWQATRRTRFQTSTTAGNTSGMRTAYVQWFRGNAAGFGGFWFRAQLGMNINLNGGQKFVGLCASIGALAGEPSALVNMCGMGYDAVDASTGNWKFMYNDGTGSAAKVDLGTDAARNTTAGYDLVMYMAPNGSELFVRIINIATNVTVLETSYTGANVPVVNTGMAFKAEVRNGAVAAADNLEIAKVYIESDY